MSTSPIQTAVQKTWAYIMSPNQNHFSDFQPLAIKLRHWRIISKTDYYHQQSKIMSEDSAVSIAIGYELDDQGVGVRVPLGARILHFSMSSRPALGPTQFLSNGYRGLLPPRVKLLGRETDRYPQLVPTSRKRGSMHPLLHTPSSRSA
jgi:hypothetical protein